MHKNVVSCRADERAPNTLLRNALKKTKNLLKFKSLRTCSGHLSQWATFTSPDKVLPVRSRILLTVLTKYNFITLSAGLYIIKVLLIY